MVAKYDGNVNSPITLNDKLDYLKATATPVPPSVSGDGGQQDMRLPAPSDAELVQRDCAGEFRAVRGERTLVAMPDGTWVDVQAKSADAIGAIRSIIRNARRSVSAAEYLLPDDYHTVLRRGVALDVMEWAETEVKSEPERFGVPQIGSEDVGGVRAYMLNTGNALDLRTLEVVVGREGIKELLIPFRKMRGRGLVWEPDLLDAPPDAAVELLDRYGTEVLRRVARNIAWPAQKDIDAIKAALPNFGKSALTRLLRKALRSLVEVVDGRTGLSANAERFSHVRRMLTEAVVLFVDEADKVTRKQDAGYLNSLTQDSVPVELKGVDTVYKERTATIMTVGNDWPDLQAGVGADARLNWAHEWTGVDELPKAQRQAWMKDGELLDWLSTYVLSEAHIILTVGDDTDTDESRATAAGALRAMTPDEELAMQEVFAEGVASEFLTVAALKQALTDAGYDAKSTLGAGPKVAQRIHTVSPRSKPERRTVGGKQQNGWTHIKLRTD